MTINWFLFDYTLIIRFITIIILLLLLRIYIGSYKKIKIGYTLGLIVFATLLLLIVAPSFVYMFTVYFSSAVPDFPAFTNDMAFSSTILLFALSVLYKITNS